MRPLAFRGQRAAKGVLHVQQRTPYRPAFSPDGQPALDPKGYWVGQHTNVEKVERRALLRVIGRRQLLKRVKAMRRDAKAAKELMP